MAANIIERVALTKIRLDGGTQIRVSIHQDSVAEYAENLAELPPADVFFDGAAYWLGDGFHRYHAHAKAGAKSMPCAVHKGTQRDAILFAVGSNSRHGIRRTNEEKRRAVRVLLDDDEWSKLVDRDIAKRCDVSHEFVRQQRQGNAKNVNVDKPKPKNRVSDSKTQVEDDDVPVFFDDDKPARTTPAAVEKDEAGQPIKDEKVLAVYRRRGEITELMQAVSRIKSAVDRAVEHKDPLFRFINVSVFLADCGNVHRALRFARPHALCPYCGGRGCKTCKGGGWVNETTYKNYTPEELKV